MTIDRFNLSSPGVTDPGVQEEDSPVVALARSGVDDLNFDPDQEIPSDRCFHTNSKVNAEFRCVDCFEGGVNVVISLVVEPV